MLGWETGLTPGARPVLGCSPRPAAQALLVFIHGQEYFSQVPPEGRVMEKEKGLSLWYMSLAQKSVVSSGQAESSAVPPSAVFTPEWGVIRDQTISAREPKPLHRHVVPTKLLVAVHDCGFPSRALENCLPMCT